VFFTIGIGGSVGVVSVLAFLLVPDGIPGVLASFALAFGISLFHCSSAAWGMQFVEGAQSFFTTGAVMGHESIIVVVVLQGALSQIVTAMFSTMAATHSRQAGRQLAVAQALGRHIANMDLDSARKARESAPNPTALEETLDQIVENLELFRPYLPDTLFAGRLPMASNGTADVDVDLRNDTFGSSSAGDGSFGKCGSCRIEEIEEPEVVHLGRVDTMATRKPSVGVSEYSASSKAPKGTQRLAVGLSVSRFVILRIRLLGMKYAKSKDMNCAAVEDILGKFMDLVTREIKAHGGTIVSCASGTGVGTWPTPDPSAAMECATIIRRLSSQSTVQVVQTGRFLAGNLGSRQLRTFNIFGPMDWAGQLLLRRIGPESHILITAPEWESLRLHYACLPFEYIWLDGAPTVLFTVLAALPERPHDLPVRQQLRHVDLCFQAYCQGRYDAARELLSQAQGLPSWYAEHFLGLIDWAESQRVTDPVKSVDTLGW